MTERYFLKVLRRATAAPQATLPLAVRSVCHARLAPGQHEDHHMRDFTKVIWPVEGAGQIRLGPRIQPLDVRHVAVFFPGTVHWARAVETEWHLRWWTMDGRAPTALLRGFGITGPGVYPASRVPEDLFDAMESALLDLTPAGEFRASTCAYELLCRAFAPLSTEPTADAVSRARATLDRDWASPETNVKTLAAHVGIHRSQLTRAFHRAFGMPPMEYLARLRMQHAMALLKQTTRPIEDVARACGFADPNYFSRAFLRRQGVTPRDYRRR